MIASHMDKAIIQKYRNYEYAVQSPEHVIDFIQQEYRRINGRRAQSLREDFCGTGWMACEWVRRGPQQRAVGVDLSPEPILFGKEFHYAKLRPAQQKRMRFKQENVLKAGGKFDVIVAMNFSYCIFKTRSEIVKYFKQVRKSLKPKGLFILDLFGGTEAQIAEKTRLQYGTLTYFWECKSFNVVTNEGKWAIHFKRKGKRLERDVFTYDWRLWGCPELLDIMKDAGFSMTRAYWEGDGKDGGGNDIFTATTNEENCNVWNSYLVAQC